MFESPESANLWFDIFNGVLLTGAFLVAVGTWGTIKTASVKERFSDDRVSANELETKRAIADSDAAKEGAAKANEAIAKANAQIAEANERTEQLKKENLLLETAIAPRIMEQSRPAAALKKFAGMKVFISFVPEYEAQRFAGGLYAMLKMAEWIPEVFREIDPQGITDGITIEWTDGRTAGPGPPVEPDWSTRGREAALALAEEFKKQDIPSRTTSRWPMDRPGLRPGIPPEALWIKVGARSSQYFVERKFPEINEQREQWEKGWAEGMQRIQELKRRLLGPNPADPAK